MTITSRFADAVAYAVSVHDGQVRKGTEIPYVTHCLAVAALVLEHGGTEDEAIGALLHDVLEDQPRRTSYQEVADQFGTAVADIARGSSDSEGRGRKAPWRERKEQFLVRLATASPSTCLVKAADSLHNLRAIIRDHREIGDAVWKRFQATPEETLWYQNAVVEALRDRIPAPLWSDLWNAVAALARVVRESRVEPR